MELRTGAVSCRTHGAPVANVSYNNLNTFYTECQIYDPYDTMLVRQLSHRILLGAGGGGGAKDLAQVLL